MKITETLYVIDREDWRAWLKENHSSKKEIWLIYYKKHTGKPRIPYDDAVEEAICYGWIDSTVKRLDDEKYAQRYTPRRKGSIWSDTNVLRVKKMLEAKKIMPVGMKKIPEEVLEAAKSGKIKTKGAVIPKVLPEPSELTKALAGNKKAKKNWDGFSPSHRKMYIYWIGDAKRPETKKRRIKKVIEMAEQNKKTMM